VVENLRARSGRELAWPPRRGVVASPTSIVGSPDPISAVSEFVSAVEHLSVADLLASLDPVESDALQRTASWWLDGVQRSLDRLVERTNLEIRFTDPQYIATTKGTRSLVRLRGIQGGLRAGRFDVTIIENCASFSNPGQADTRQCFTGSLGDRDGALAELGRIGVPTPAVSAVRFYDDLRRAVTGVADNGIVARQIAGRWYVSLGGSITKLLLDIVSGGDRNAMQSMIDDARSLAGAVVDNAHSSGSATGPGATPGTAAPGDTATGTPDSVDNYGRYTECLASTDYDEARACISAGIAKGIINRAEVSGSFLYPECGWKGSRYDPTLAKLSNANYVSLATAASQCLEAKVAQGLLTALQVPFELVRVDCLKGVNPFRMSPPMTRAYLDCQLQGAPSAAG
jgi:hypothetical protein